MASFLDELGMTLFGQNELPDFQQVSSADLLGRSQSLLPQIGEFNRAIGQQQVGLIPIEQQLRAGRFGSAINPLQEAYTSNILANLNMGSALPEDLQQEVIRGALQGSAASGFGLSPGGRALVGRDLGLSSLELARQRRGEAFNALQAFPGQRIEGQLSPTTAIDLERNSIDVANQRRAQEAGLRNANRAAIIASLKSYAETGGAIAGEVIGHAFGTSEIGSGAGSLLSGIGSGGSAAGAGASSMGGGVSSARTASYAR